jgi:hypothetical protein
MNLVFIKSVRISVDRAWKLACMSYLSPKGIKYVVDARLPPAVSVYEWSDGSTGVVWSRSCS